MKDQRDFDRAVDRWLDDGSDVTPHAVIDAVLLAARSTPQERDLRIAWRTSPMKHLAYAAAAVAAIAVGAAALSALGPRFGIGSEPTPTGGPAADLGIFEPVAGQVVYYTNSSLWAVDPSTPARLVPLVPASDQFAPFTMPLGWSSNGTELLFVREDPTDLTFPYDRHLFILHADGTETQVTPEPVGGAAISPDGSRVIFAADRDSGLYVIDASGGQPVLIAHGKAPTFSPDGRRIAYLSLPRGPSGVQEGREHVWVANADGSNAHEILADEPVLAQGVFELAWSPTGDRIAMANSLEDHVAIYTFASDGSGFKKVITGGFNPFWSPDGSQIAYGVPGRDGLWIADADGSNIRSSEFGAPGPWHPGE